MVIFFFDDIQQMIDLQIFLLLRLIHLKEQRYQSDRRDQGCHQGEYNRKTQLHKDLSGHSTGEAQRQIYNNRCDGGCHNRGNHFCGTLQCCLFEIRHSISCTETTLDHDTGAVYHHTDGDDQTTQSHNVQREAHQSHNDHCHEQRDWH